LNFHEGNLAGGGVCGSGSYWDGDGTIYDAPLHNNGMKPMPYQLAFEDCLE